MIHYFVTMYCLSKLCYVCLNNRNNLQRIVHKESIARIIEMLEYCTFNGDWMKTRKSIYICVECHSNMQKAYDFITTCRRTTVRMQGYISQLKHSIVCNPNPTAELNIKLVDINKTNHHDVDAQSMNIDSIYCTKLEIKEENLFDEIPPEECSRLHPVIKEELLTPAIVDVRSSSIHSEVDCAGYKSAEISHWQEFSKELKNTLSKLQIEYSKFNEQMSVNIESIAFSGSSNCILQLDFKNYKAINSDEKLCSKRFINLNRHNVVHTGEKPYRCLVCSKQFDQKSYLVAHNKIHTGEKPHKYLICSKRYVSKSRLNKHNVIHTDESLYKCLVCSKRFTQKSYLVAHNKIHIDEKLYKCSICSKLFASKSNLNRHNAIHTGERPYKCLVCSKQFAQKSNLVAHRATHTGERPYKCLVCNKQFTRKFNLVVHIVTHTGEKPYKCVVCHKRFTQKSTLIVHHKIHAGNDKLSFSKT